MTHCRRLRFFSTVFLILASAALAGFSQARGPRVEFKEESWNFGRIKQGEVVAHEFVFKNTGSDVLVVKNVTTSCGCTAALVSEREILPGKEGKLSVSFDSRGYAGRVIKYVYFESNDPRNPRKELKIEVEVETGPAPRIEIEPYNLDLGLVLEGEPAEAEIKVRNSGQLELTIDIDYPGVNFMVGGKSIRFPYRIPAGREIVLKITLPAVKDRRGAQRDYLMVKSNDPARPAISIFISRYVITREELKSLFEKYGKVLGIKN